MRIFTLENGMVSVGAKIEKLHFKGTEISIFAIVIGEEGRGRKRGILPISNLLTDTRLMFAEVEDTKTGMPKLLARKEFSNDNFVILVMRTQIGFRGGNSHTGDCIGWECLCCKTRGYDMIDIPYKCPSCGKRRDGKGPNILFAPFPGEIITKGIIAQGDFGIIGRGEQIVAIAPKDVVFRTSYFGRLYGAPSSHYYKWNGHEMLVATEEERLLSESF